MRSKAFLPKIMMCKLNRIGSLAPGSAKLLSRVDLFLSERGGGGQFASAQRPKQDVRWPALFPGDRVSP